MIGYIYELTGENLKGSYIGSTVAPRKRKYKHLRSLQKNIHYNKDLQKYYNENGEGSVIFNILKEFEVDSREKIFEVEQAFIEEYESLKRCLNQNKSVRVVKIENFSNYANRNFKTFEEYFRARIIMEFDGFHYHIKEIDNVGDDSLVGVKNESLYLEYTPKWNKLMDNFSEEEKFNLYKIFVKRYISGTKPQRGFTVYQYLQIIIYDNLGFARIQIAKIMNMNPQSIGDLFSENKRTPENFIKAQKIFNTLSFAEKIDVISEQKIQTPKVKFVPFSLISFIDILNRHENGDKITNISKDYSSDRTVISKYINFHKTVPIHILNQYNKLTDKEKEIVIKTVRSNPLLLPRL